MVFAVTLAMTACGGSLHNVSIGAPQSRTQTLDKVIINEVCSTIEYITYDDQKDTPETLRQIEAHNEVLFTVYHCELPQGPSE